MSTTTQTHDLKQLLSQKTFITVPKEGDLIRGIVVSASPREVLVDIEGFKTGIIRGYEVGDLKNLYPNLKVGDLIEATVLELENEDGQVELSLKFAGKLRTWDAALQAKTQNTTVEVKITDANRGGLMATWAQMAGFIPVSQLAPEHYPRVTGGDKAKILERLRTLIGENLRVKVLDCDPQEDKLIFSEKTLWEEEQKDLIGRYKVGDTIEGTITAIADFGVFVGFDSLEGLVHISEIAWQRLDHPGDVVKVGDQVRAQILNIQGSKIFLSMRALIDDPWKLISQRYSIGQEVQGKVLKVNPFGLFVELDPEIHGLAHVSQLNIDPAVPVEQQVKPGDTRTFKIVAIEPEHHRLGLSEKARPEAAKEPDEPKVAELAPISAEQKLQSGEVAEEAAPVV